jgi:RNA-directed DNA polymerase
LTLWAFHVRQYPVGKHRTRTYRGKPGYKTIIKPSRQGLQRHRDKLRASIQQHRGAPQAGLVYALNPVIQGWANYYQYCVAKRDFQILDNTLYHQLTRWARYRHPRKTGGWSVKRYWKRKGERLNFGDGTAWLVKYADTPIK